MQKLFVIVLSALMLLSCLTACGGEKAGNDTPKLSIAISPAPVSSVAREKPRTA